MAQGKGLFKRGPVWWVQYAGPDGRIVRESTKTTVRKEAEEILTLRRSDVQKGVMPLPVRARKTTFRELAEQYVEWARPQKAFTSKWYFVQDLIRQFGDLPLAAFTTRFVEQYQARFLEEGKKPATANRCMATLKHMFTKAVEWEMATEEALRRVRRVKLLAECNRRLRYLSEEECRTLVEACDPQLRPVVVTALNTGMRRGEILSLQWEKHVDLRHGFLLLDRTKNGERREIPINDVLRETLQSLVRRVDLPYVFLNREGKPYRDVGNAFESAVRRAGLKDFHFHDLRHTFASHLVMAGVDIVTVKELLGHKTLAMTLRYSHLAPAHKQAALSLLSDRMRGANCTSTAQNGKRGQASST